jgi:arylsulfatase
MSAPRSKYTYFPGTGEVEASTAVSTHNRSHTITAEVEVAKDGVEGVLLANGGGFGGYSFFVNKDQKLQYSHNYLGLVEGKVVSSEKVPAGKSTLRMDFQVTGPPDFKAGKGAPGVAKLFINGKEVGSAKINDTVPLAFSLSGDGLCCGRDSLTSVSADYRGRGDYIFTGTIRRVIVDVAPPKMEQPKAPDRD